MALPPHLAPLLTPPRGPGLSVFRRWAAGASLPAAAQLVDGTGSFLVILNADGDFTIFSIHRSTRL